MNCQALRQDGRHITLRGRVLFWKTNRKWGDSGNQTWRQWRLVFALLGGILRFKRNAVRKKARQPVLTGLLRDADGIWTLELALECGWLPQKLSVLGYEAQPVTAPRAAVQMPRNTSNAQTNGVASAAESVARTETTQVHVQVNCTFGEITVVRLNFFFARFSQSRARWRSGLRKWSIRWREAARWKKKHQLLLFQRSQPMLEKKLALVCKKTQRMNESLYPKKKKKVPCTGGSRASRQPCQVWWSRCWTTRFSSSRFKMHPRVLCIPPPRNTQQLKSTSKIMCTGLTSNMSPRRNTIATHETMSAWFWMMNSWLITGGFLLLFFLMPMLTRLGNPSTAHTQLFLRFFPRGMAVGFDTTARLRRGDTLADLPLPINAA